MRTGSALCDSNAIGNSCIFSWCLDSLIQEDLLRFEVSDLRRGHLRALERVVLKETFFDATIRELHATSSILDSFDPLTFVARSVLPEHLTVTVSLIVFVTTLIVVATLPSEQAHSILLVVLVRALVHVAVLIVEAFLPLALAVLEAVLELSDVDAAVLPLVLALALGLSIDVDAREDVTVREKV